MMTSLSKLFCGITILTIPTIAYGGCFLLTVFSGDDKTALTDFQKGMFRAGHAHAGVLVILTLIAQLLLDKYTDEQRHGTNTSNFFSAGSHFSKWRFLCIGCWPWPNSA